jgi:26S proteasome regulatory subunit N3
MNYTEAANLFSTALRKAPQDSAIGFKQEVNKWVVAVRLLQGEVPERSIFYTSYLRVTLAPYFAITKGF